MANLSPVSIINFLIRMGLAILFVVLMMLMFYSFKVVIKQDDMERSVFELSDSLTSNTNLIAGKSIFSTDKLTKAERDEIEMYVQNCEFGYQAEIESRGRQTACESDGGCSGFCGRVCGIDSSSINLGIFGNCNCNLEVFGADFCECKKNGEWQDNYRWRLGYNPDSVSQVSSEFPVGIETADTALPATMRITVYDSFLTRISCAAAKAFYTKEEFAVKFATAHLPTGTTAFKRSGADGTHVCLYSGNEPLKEQCRYMPLVPVDELDIIRILLASESINKVNWKITAYPLKSSVTCDEVKSSPSAIASGSGEIAKVLLCMEALE